MQPQIPLLYFSKYFSQAFHYRNHPQIYLAFFSTFLFIFYSFKSLSFSSIFFNLSSNSLTFHSYLSFISFSNSFWWLKSSIHKLTISFSSSFFFLIPSLLIFSNFIQYLSIVFWNIIWSSSFILFLSLSIKKLFSISVLNSSFVWWCSYNYKHISLIPWIFCCSFFLLSV